MGGGLCKGPERALSYEAAGGSRHLAAAQIRAFRCGLAGAS
jgi:hypothetical protein